MKETVSISRYKAMADVNSVMSFVGEIRKGNMAISQMSIMMNFSADSLSNRKCRILFDMNGEKLEEPFIVEYDYMNSEELELMPFMEGRYLGKGECVSVFDSKTNTERRLSGEGYFYKKPSRNL